MPLTPSSSEEGLFWAPSDEGAGCALAQTEGEKPIDRYTYAVFEA